ncbi:MAG: 4Fe-4S binding protein [Candidatus Njordarchaeales archaeon]
MGLLHFKPTEKSILRKIALMLYARFEIPYLKLNYLILKGPYKNRIGRLLIYPVILLNSALMLGLGQHGKVMTYKEVEKYIDELPDNVAISVGSCRCRVATKACDCPIETDMTIKTGAIIYKSFFPEDYKLITKSEAKKLVKQLNKSGLVSMVYAFCIAGGSFTSFVICHCCKHSCIPILAQRIVGLHVFDPGDYVAYVDPNKCQGCGICVEVCQFEARRIVDGKAKIDYLSCYGCGACVLNCPNQATKMVKRPEKLRRAQISRLLSFWKHEHYSIA